MRPTLRHWLVLAPVAQAATRGAIRLAQAAGWLDCFGVALIEPNDEVIVYRAHGPLARALARRWEATAFAEAIVVWARWDGEALQPGHTYRVLRHHAEHVRQRRRLGVFFLLAYLGACACALPHPYRDNALERAARRAAWRLP